MAVAVAVVPTAEPAIVDAMRAGGGTLIEPERAEAIVWTDPFHPEELAAVLEGSPATWVQLPFAGIERFVAAGVLDDGHVWTCAKGVYGPATAEHALALMLAAARRLHEAARARSWNQDERGRRLAGMTVVLVGTGGIGAALVEMLAPLGPKVIAVNRSGRPLHGADRTVTIDSLPNVAGEADFLVLAAPVTERTRRMVGRDLLARLSPGAWIVNVSRGALVDTEALVDALRAGTIGGAALDVTDPEPLPDGHPLWSFENVIITSHVANTWAMALPELAGQVRRNVERFARGQPLEGLVDPALGY